MADGKWVMTDEDMKRVDLTFGGKARQDVRRLPNYGQHIPVDDREGTAAKKCAFCVSDDLMSGFGGSGEGFGYRSYKCRACGGTTDLVYQDDAGKYFG
jgi:hypothetical protein